MLKKPYIQLPTKTCTICRKEKDISFFSRRNERKNGYRSWCRECRTKQNRHYRTVKKPTYWKEYHARNVELIREKSRKYMANLWRTQPEVINSRSAQRRGAEKRATPKWANMFFVHQIYHLALLRTKHLGKEYQVDHVIPLRHPLVCGLHNEFNLRVVPAEVNFAKRNIHNV